MDRLTQTLSQYWGYQTFRSGQREIIQAVIDGRPVLGVMPTGAGKSLCYQLPALILPGLTLVVSPLIALMKDQVDQLRSRGITAACINSAMSPAEQMQILNDARDGHLKLLYVAPERFRYEGALARLKRLPISFFAVDEAHCISHWGHDFRPDYQHLGQAHRDLNAGRVAAYTATATEEVRADIVASLGLENPLVKVAGFARDNLHLSVVNIARMKDKPRIALKAFQAGLAEGGVGIVYCATRKHCEEAVDELRNKGFEVLLYHGGLPDEARSQAQEQFQKGNKLIMVATNAFGMGVDKPDVRVVVHWDFPGSIDAYYQEVGRGGRDGKRAWGVMLFTYADSRIHEFFIDNAGEHLSPKDKARRAEVDRAKLKAIQRFAYYEGCRHAFLLRYFGDTECACDLSDPQGSRCDRCTNDTGLKLTTTGAALKGSDTGKVTRVRDIAEPDGPRHAKRKLVESEEIIIQKVLSAIARAQGRLDIKSIARALRGSKATDVVKGPLYSTKSFGILDAMPEGVTIELLKALGEAGCTQGYKPTLTPLGVEVMWRRAPIELAMPPFSWMDSQPKLKAPSASLVLSDKAEMKLRELKAKRLALAKERGVAPFVIASNAVLESLAQLKPRASSADWLQIRGIGSQNVSVLQEAFRELIDRD